MAGTPTAAPWRRRVLISLLTVSFSWVLVIYLLSKSSSWSARIYDDLIVAKLTSAWYEAVLQQLVPNTILLDVGIGTAGALLRHKEVIRSKHLRVFGVDVSKPYLEAAELAIARHELQDLVHVENLSIYDVNGIFKWIAAVCNDTTVDAVYFSGSFSLLPDPPKALVNAQHLLPPGGRVYITQTYASSIHVLGKLIKPLIRYVTTIDFGQLVSEAQALQVFKSKSLSLQLIQHDEIPQKKNRFRLSPPAFLSVLELTSEDNGTESCAVS